MASITVRNIDDTLKERLRVRAATHGHSMEEEVRLILKQAVGRVTGSGLLSLSQDLFSGNKGIDLELPSRQEDRTALDFGA